MWVQTQGSKEGNSPTALLSSKRLKDRSLLPPSRLPPVSLSCDIVHCSHDLKPLPSTRMGRFAPAFQGVIAGGTEAVRARVRRGKSTSRVTSGRRVHPRVPGSRAALDSWECGSTQNCQPYFNNYEIFFWGDFSCNLIVQILSVNSADDNLMLQCQNTGLLW